MKHSIFITKADSVRTNKYFNLRDYVKFPGKITCTIVVFIIITGAAGFRQTGSSFAENVDQYFEQQLQSLTQELKVLKIYCDQKAARATLAKQFAQCRQVYKKLAVLSEYFNVYETKFLNGPALPRSEDGTPDVIIAPQGFQAIEELIFGDAQEPDHARLNELLEKMSVILGQMQKEPDRANKFRPELVWDALRSSIVRLTALGITGFDSPVALHSLSEARSTVEGMKNILLLFKPEVEQKTPGTWKNLDEHLKEADNWFARKKDFNHFDRLAFITSCINPLYKELVVARKKAGIGVPEGRSPVNFDATSMFGKDFFQIAFFSPGEEYRVTEQRVVLGKKLFSDPILSGSNNRSCASCHIPEKAFADGLMRPFSMDNKTLLKRNTPTLWNSTLQTRQFYDSRTDILENQLKEVVHNTEEMEGSLNMAAAALKEAGDYVQLFREAYPQEKEPLNAFNIANAISSYIRTLVSLESGFDLYMQGQQKKLSGAQKRGFNLFTGKAKCATCHFIPLFNGLVPPDFTETESEVLGVPANKVKKQAKLDDDRGKFEISRSIIHQYAFKTPSLRNIELTAPYMHNGVFDTLEEVMEFYNNGGGAGLDIAPDNQTLPADPLKLNKREIADIIAFMKALTDTSAIIKKPSP